MADVSRRIRVCVELEELYTIFGFDLKPRNRTALGLPCLISVRSACRFIQANSDEFYLSDCCQPLSVPNT